MQKEDHLWTYPRQNVTCHNTTLKGTTSKIPWHVTASSQLVQKLLYCWSQFTLFPGITELWFFYGSSGLPCECSGPSLRLVKAKLLLFLSFFFFAELLSSLLSADQQKLQNDMQSLSWSSSWITNCCFFLLEPPGKSQGLGRVDSIVTSIALSPKTQLPQLLQASALHPKSNIGKKMNSHTIPTRKLQIMKKFLGEKKKKNKHPNSEWQSL